MYFLTRAMAFFAGWSWITLCRDFSTLLAYHDAQTPARNYSGQFLVAFALGPMLTFFLIRAEDGGRGGEEGSAGDGEWDETAPQPDNYVLTEG